ncbi:MAG: hypothetical protein E7813_15340 [Bradyrhizobium sp.]|uniref:hypothetical protein n=1 Tax=Bradyrhizobium sp. TaxID=376 RepID=UPI0011FFE0F9|nr:hypothetical protein [Bradyrhizobium sp.]THD65334.1 MAG: hypothetical protein E7813_15340 [Bradyrhizobium sp.]
MPKVRYLDDDEGDIIRDGEILRTSMMARDAARSISVGAFGDNTRYDSQPTRTTIVDSQGRSDPMLLRRPGARFLSYDKRSVEHAKQATQNVMRAEMYDDVKNELSASWRSPACEPSDGSGNRSDAMPVNDSREAAYSDYRRYVENAWRRK